MYSTERPIGQSQSSDASQVNYGTVIDQRGQIVYGGQTNVVHSAEPELTPGEVGKQLALYRERLLADTSLVNLTGIPFPSVDRSPKISLQTVYIHIQALEEDQSKEMRKREVADLEAQMQKIAGEIDAHGHRLSLLQLLTLGEYYYRRGETVEQQERPAPVDPIQAAQDHQRLVLLGAPGSGKSTLLRYLAHQATASADGPIPILFPLSHFGIARAKDINATLREDALRYAAAGDPLILRALQQAVGENQILWLLDGLDETQDKTVSQQISALPNQDRIVVTSRPIGYQPHPLGSFSLFEILPLTVDNSHKFIRDWMTTLGPEGAEESIVWLKQQLHERPWLQPLTSNPLLLTFLVILACEHPRRALPSTRHALYKRYIDSLFTTWEKERNEKLLTLPSPLYHQGILSIGWYLHLAYFGHTHSSAEAGSIKIGSDFIPRRESISKRLADYLQQHETALLQGTSASVAAADIVTFWLTTGLLQERTWGEYTLLTFRHLTFQEYCVATMLHQAWQRQSSRTWPYLKPRLHLASWRESLLLLSEMMETSEIDQLINYLLKHPSPYDRALQRDVRLAAVLLGENKQASDAVTWGVIKRLDRLIQSSNWKFQTTTITIWLLVAIGLIFIQLQLGIPGWGIATVIILWIVICAGIFMFALFPRMAAILRLPLRVWQLTPIRTPFIEALGNIHHPAAVDALNRCFSFNEKVYIRLEIAKALSNIGQTATAPLIRIAADDNEDVRNIVAKALVRIGEPAVDLLLQELRVNSNLNPVRPSKYGPISVYYYRRATIAQILGKLQDKRAVEPLLALLKQENAPVIAIAQALGEIGDDRATGPLAQLVYSGEWENDEAIINALSQLGQSAVTHLVQILGKNKRYRVESLAAEALGRIGDPRAIQPLLEIICNHQNVHYTSHDFYWLQQKAAEALSLLDNVPIQSLIDTLKSAKRKHAIEFALEKIGEPAVVPLVRLLYSDDWKLYRSVIDTLINIGRGAVRHLLHELANNDIELEPVDPSHSAQLRHLIGIIQTLGGIADSRAVPYLVSALATSNLAILVESIRALGYIKDKLATNHLLPFLEHHHRLVRYVTVEAFRAIKDTVAVPSLIKLLKTEQLSQDNTWSDPYVESIRALGEIGGDDATTYLLTLLDHQDDQIRKLAIQALGETGNSKAVIPLITHLHDNSNSDAVANALAQIGALTVNPLAAAAESIGKAEQAKIISILSKIKNHESLSALIQLLPMLDDSLDQEAQRLLENLEVTLYPIWWFDSPHIDRTLETGDAEKIATLTTALKYGLTFALPYLSEYDRLDSVRGLVKAGDITCVSVLLNVFNNKKESDLVRAATIEGLGKLAGVALIDLLLITLSDRTEDWRVRSAAVHGLRFLQDNRATAAIERSLRDTDYFVRKNAVDVVQEWVTSEKLEKEKATEWLVAAIRGSIWKYGIHPFFETRSNAIFLLASVGTAQAIKPLLKLQYSTSVRIREGVAYALGELSEKMTNTEKLYVMLRLWCQLTDYGPFYGMIHPAAQVFVALEKIANQYSTTHQIDLFSDD